ncbi:MAG: GldM family protein, partial [Flavobacteriales bacterium]
SMRPEDADLSAAMDRLFDMSDRKDAGGTMNTWESINFYHVPLAAGITIMSKIQADVRNAEGEVVKRMLDAVEGKSFKFNKLTAIVKPQSSYVTVGSKYQAEIFLGAYDDQNAPTVWICGPGERVDTTSKPPKIIGGNGTILPMNGAKAILERTASGAGLQQVSGIIKYKPVGGEEQIEAFYTEYEVATPNLVVSPTKMNVFYRGVDNPVRISVSGYSDKDITPTKTNGDLVKGTDGSWIMRPGKESEALIGATVKNPDGSSKTMAGEKFRVKNVPNPTPYFGGKSVNDENIKKAELTAAAGVIAKMVDFDFDLKFEVVEFKVTMIVGGTPLEQITKGAAVSGQMKEMFQKAKPGQKVYIEGIKARGPDGTVRNLGSLSFKVV